MSNENEIPEPIRQKKDLTDQREKYLREWKKLFRSVHPDITVTLHTDKDFGAVLSQTLEDLDFERFNDNAKIIVNLPKELKLEYLIGLGDDEMYSHDEVLEDRSNVEEHHYPYQPMTYTWESFYNRIYRVSIINKGQIPKPPIDPGQDAKLNLSVEDFIRFSPMGKRVEHLLLYYCNNYNKLATTVTVLDLLKTHTRRYNMMQGMGVLSWKKLMQGFYNLGIKNCFDYPIANDPQRVRMTKEFIEACKKEILGE